MNICSLRARTLDDKLYAFTIVDVPVIVGDNQLALLNRRFSPLLKFNTTHLGSDVGVYVGDVLKDIDGSEWCVSFDCGFIAINPKTRVRRTLYDFQDLVVVRQVTKEEATALYVPDMKFKFKYQGFVFPFLSIVGKYKDKMIISGISDKVNPAEIQQDANLSLNGKRIYYGDLYKGHPVIMCYGRTCIQNEFGVYDILEGKYIIK